MEQEGFVVGVDLGTSNIIGLLGRRNEQGVISILASESIPSDSCVKHGIVYNIDEAAGKVKKLLSLLENKVGKKIGKVYVSVAGMSLRTIEHTQTKNFGSDTTITYALLEQMEQMARANSIPLLSTYSVVSPETYLDGRLEEEPIEKQASIIEINYRLITGRPNMKSNLVRCITDKNRIGIAGYIIGPVATGAILLDDEIKRKGCALVDFGGGTTTVSIYKNGLLKYMTVVPFGGRTITRDVQSLGFTEDLAETYKIRYGRVGRHKVKNPSEQAPVDSGVDLRELNKVIQLRQEEIVLNVINQITESGYANDLEAGIIMTGGASQMNGLAEYLAEKSKMLVQTGAIKRLYINNATDLLQNPSYSQCLGIMLFAKENCEKAEASRFERRSQFEYQKHQPRPTIQQPEIRTPKQVETKPGKEEPSRFERKEEERKERIVRNSDRDIRDEKEEKEDKKNPTLFDFFGKIQNIGGAMFKDEE